MWKDQLGILPQRTFAPDLYDYGDDIQQWAKRCLSDVPTKRLVVVGCSVGGSCALEILNLAPERVVATILIGTKARHDPNPGSAAEICKFVETHGVEVAWGEYWKPLFEGWDKVCTLAETMALGQSREGLIRGLTAFHTRSSREEVVANGQSPIHIVTGDQDTLPGLDYAHRLAALNPRAQLDVIKYCGHYAPIMRPMEINALIENVIRSVVF